MSTDQNVDVLTNDLQGLTVESNDKVEQEKDMDTSHVKGFYNVKDTREILNLQVQGQLPKWLTGEHYTIGPGIYDVRYPKKIEVDGVLQSATDTFTFGHWFDGLPLVNRFDLNGERNTVTYRHLIPNKRLVAKMRDHHGYEPNYPAGLFKTNSNQTVLIKLLNNGRVLKPDRIPCGQRITTCMPGFDGQLFCQDFANHVLELNPFDLSTSRVQTFEEINSQFKGYSACPNGQYDPDTGEYINFTMEIGYRSTKYHFFSTTEQDRKGQVIATIWNAPTGWVNNFALTPNYIVMVIHPMLANTGAVKFAWSESIMDSFDFYPSEPTIFYVISRKEKGVIACYRSMASFSLNQVNAYEDMQGNIVLDIVCYNDDTIVQQLSIDNLRRPDIQLDKGQVRRFVLERPEHEAHKTYVNNNSFIPSAISITSRIGSVWNYMTGGSKQPENATGGSGWYAWMPVIEYEKLVDTTLELPQVNPNYRMKPYTFVYGLNSEDDSMWNSIVKIDVNDRSVVARWHEEHCYPSEAQFVPKPAQSLGETKIMDEDEGVLVSVVLDSARSTSFLLVLDAKDLQEIARIELNKLIPLSFAHGCHKLK